MAGSRIGFKGTEDLGNGLKALFTLEYNIAPDTNSGIGDGNSVAAGGGSNATSSQSRQTFAGLTGDFGTVVAGRLQTAGYYFAAAYTPFAGTIFDNANLIGGNLVAGSAGRLNNAVAYVSPTVGGFTFEVDHARLTESASTGYQASQASTPSVFVTGQDSSATEASIKYANGPISLQAVYLSINGAASSQRDNDIQTGLGASYDFGPAKVMYMYKTKKTQTETASTNDKVNSQNSLSVAIPVSANGTVLASYAASKIETRNDGDARGFGIGYRYALSKRTTLYANYTSVDQKDNGKDAYVTGISNTAPTGSSTAQLAGVGADTKAIGFGISHAF